MEKPRKKELLDRTQTIIHGIRAFASYGIGARIYGDGVDDIHLQRAITAAKEIEAMSAWIEGELKKIMELTDYPEEPNAKNMNEDLVWDYKERLDKIHALITRKLRGKVCE